MPDALSTTFVVTCNPEPTKLTLAIPGSFLIRVIVYANKLDNDMFALDSDYLAQYTKHLK